VEQALLDRFITVHEAAEQLRVHPQTVRLWLRAGKLRGRLIGGQKAAIASRRVKSTAFYPRTKTRRGDPTRHQTLFERTPGKSRAGTAPGDAVQFRLGWGAGRSPASNNGRAAARTDSKAERGAAPKAARSQPGGRSRQGAWRNWTQARQPCEAGAACGQGGNAPGCTSPPGVRERARHHAERPAGRICAESPGPNSFGTAQLAKRPGRALNARDTISRYRNPIPADYIAGHGSPVRE